MSYQPQRIDFEEFARRLQQVFDQVRRRNEPVLVEQDGNVFRVELQEPADIWEGYDPEKVQRALSASRGLFEGTDRERFLAELGEQREQGHNRFD